MKRTILFTLFLSFGLLSYSQKPTLTGHDYVEVSKSFLSKLKNGEDAASVVHQYKNFNFEALVSQVNTREEKLAFWVNTYNAFVQYLLTNNPELFNERGGFFTEKRVIIAGIEMSFDDIEHGIIRDSRVKLGLGILKKWFPPRFERKLRINDRDGRVHFALNCGAKSCPPIAIYDDRFIYEQLDEIAGNYLRSVSTVENNKVSTSPLFSWFRGDFGGKRGIKKLLHKYKVIETTKGIKIEYGDYDWTLKTGNYIDFQNASPTVK